MHGNFTHKKKVVLQYSVSENYDRKILMFSYISNTVNGLWKPF